MGKDEKFEKASFFQRICAYAIDVFLVSLIASLIAMPFLDMVSITKLEDSMTETADAYLSGEIDEATYLSESAAISYQSAKKYGALTIITIFLEILYFIVYQVYNKGQTLGKRLFKIKVESTDDSEVTMNQMIYRTLIIDSILYSFVNLAFVVFAGQSTYFYGMLVFELVQYTVMIVCGLMVMFSKNGRGLHDLVSHTRVVRLD